MTARPARRPRAIQSSAADRQRASGKYIDFLTLPIAVPTRVVSRSQRTECVFDSGDYSSSSTVPGSFKYARVVGRLFIDF